MLVKPCGFEHKQKQVNNPELIEEFKKIHNERLEKQLNECLENIKSRSYEYINTPVLDSWMNNLAVTCNENKEDMLKYLDHFIHARIMDGLQTEYYQKTYFELPEYTMPSNEELFKIRFGDCGQKHQFIGNDHEEEKFIFDYNKKREPILVRTEKVISG